MPPGGGRDITSGVGVRLVDAPLERQDEPRAHIYIVDHLNPGDEIVRRFEVTNYSDERRDVQLYPGAATVDKTGFTFAEENRARNELTSWVRIQQNAVALDPKASATLTVTVTVPLDATVGEHYGVLWAELPAQPDPAANVMNVGRAGIRMYISIGPGGEPRSDFTLSDLRGARAPGGDPEVVATVRNTGGRALNLHGELRLTDAPGGISVGPVPVEIDTIGVSETADVRVRLATTVPDGPWQARLVLTGGKVQREATGTLTFGRRAVRSSATAKPATLIAASALVGTMALTLLGLLAYRRRSR